MSFETIGLVDSNSLHNFLLDPRPNGDGEVSAPADDVVNIEQNISRCGAPLMIHYARQPTKSHCNDAI